MSITNEKINIMHIRDSTGIYGAERVILTLGKHINRQQYNVTLLCMRYKDGRSEKLITRAKQTGIHVIPVDMKGRIDFYAIAKIRRIFKENKVSLLHSHDYKSDLYALLASMNLGIKRVVTAHGSTRDSFLKRVYLFVTEHLIYRFFDKIIAVSQDIYLQLQNKRLKPECIKVIQNGIDFSLISSEMDNENSKNFLFFSNSRKVFAVIGRLFPDKGHHFFLQAFSKVLSKDQSIMALIVGDGPAKDLIAKQVRELKLENHVNLCGVRSDMKNVYNSIDFLVIPSLREGLPYVLLEAMSNKIPVLATSVGDIPILVDDKVTGYLVAPGDTEALERRMIELLTNPEKAKEMAERGHQLVTERFSEKRMVRDTEDLYKSLFV